MQINILEYLESTVRKYPHKTAVADGERKISFSDLDDRAKVLGSEIINYGFQNKPIAVFLPKSAECVISDIAITFSGNLYMNLDIHSPDTRLLNVIEQVQPEIIITQTKYLDRIQKYDKHIPVINYDDIDFKKDVKSDEFDSIRSKLIDTDPLCIINTSGSTGTPKSAVLNHRSYIDYTDWAISTFHFSSNETLGVLSPVIFDHYNYEICLMMATGCTLVLLDNQNASFPVLLLESLKKNEVSYIFWVPSILAHIANLDLLSKIEIPTLKMIWFAGEVFPTKQYNYWRKYFPDATFVNLYGPVETSVDCTYFVIDREFKDDEPIPIGSPCRNTDILVLNDENKPVEVNETGELYVRGTSLAMGYYNNPEKTSEVFIQNPLNTSYRELIYKTGDVVLLNERKELIFKGRKDTLIKHMGYRIELLEIEHIIVNTLKLVSNGCIVYDFSSKEIILFYENNENLSVSDARKILSDVVPKYMIPTKYIRKNELPRNPNGKIDRLLLSRSIEE